MFQRTPSNPRYAFDTAAGRYLVLCCLGSARDEQAQTALKAVLGRPDLFHDDLAAFLAVSSDPRDEAEARLDNRLPGFRVFWDFDLTIARAYRAVPKDADPTAGTVTIARQ